MRERGIRRRSLLKGSSYVICYYFDHIFMNWKSNKGNIHHMVHTWVLEDTNSYFHFNSTFCYENSFLI